MISSFLYTGLATEFRELINRDVRITASNVRNTIMPNKTAMMLIVGGSVKLDEIKTIVKMDEAISTLITKRETKDNLPLRMPQNYAKHRASKVEEIRSQ